MAIQRLIAGDDLRHAHSSAKWWNESAYFNFFDPSGRIGGVSRIGFSPGYDLIDGFLALRLEDGTLLLTRTHKSFEPPKPGDRVLRAGPITYRCIEPLERWEVSFDGDMYVMDGPETFPILTTSGPWALPRRRVRLSVTFAGYHPAFPYPSLPQRMLPLREVFAPRPGGSQLDRVRLAPEFIRNAVAMRGNGHFEQAGHTLGEVEIDGERQAVAGTGNRDRSWGIRDWRLLTRYRWINAQFGDALAFSAFRVRLIGFEAWGGYVWHEGRLSLMGDWSREEHADGTATLTLRPEGGEELSVRVQTTTPIPMTLADVRYRTVLNEAIAKFEWRGLESRGANEHVQRSYP